MITESALKRISSSVVLNRARTIAARGYPIFNRQVSYRKKLTVLRAAVDTETDWNGPFESTVTIDEAKNTVVGYSCTCTDAEPKSHPGPCKHCLAVVLDFNRNMRSYAGYDPLRFVRTSACIADYLDENEQKPTMDLQLEAPETGTVTFEMELIHYFGDWNVRFKIQGARGSYVVSDITDLLEHCRHGEYHAYGKKLGFTHTKDSFTPYGLAVLQFLEKAQSQRRSFENHSYRGYGLNRIARDLHLSIPELDELLQMHADGRPFMFKDESQSGAKTTKVVLEQGNPDVSIQLKELSAGGFEIVRGRPVNFVNCSSHMYAWQNNRFFQCTDEFRSVAGFLTHVYSNPVNQLFVAEDDLPRFTGIMLPAIERIAQVDVPETLESLRPAPCKLEFYLDRDSSGVEAVCKSLYGQRTFNLFERSAPHDSHIVRDLAAEARARETVQRYITSFDDDGTGHIEDGNSEAMARFAFEGVLELQKLGDVFTTEAFDRLASKRRPSVSVGLSIKSNLIDVSIHADDLPANELAAVLASYREERKYHRMKDGSFLDMSGFDLSQADAVIQELGLTSRQITSGEAEVPVYEAFLLDELVDDDAKDATFTTWVDGFKGIDPDQYMPPIGLNATLRPYQVLGFQWLSGLCDSGFGGILADEMGLGKSLQLITLLLDRRSEARLTGPSLIVCPASLVYNWKAEFERFAPQLDVVTVSGTAAERVAARASRADVLVTSYDLLRRDIGDYESMHFFCEVLDEAQYIKNQATITARAVKRLDALHRFALTGTPIENRLSELWSIFDFLMPGLLGSYKRFRDRYEQPIFDGDTNVSKRLQSAVAPFILRRLKKDVLTDLPEKLESVIYAHLEGKQLELYRAHEQMLRQKIASQTDEDMKDGTQKIEVLAELMHLRQICCDPHLMTSRYNGPAAKLDALSDLIGSCMDAGQKMLVFSQFKSFLDIIADRLDEQRIAHFAITGDTPSAKRLELVERFNADDTPVFLISLKAGGTGLNLTGASVVIHADPWWNAAAQNQATDRAHRIGQTHVVSVHKIIAKDTIEERIMALQDAKRDLAEQIIGATEGSSLATLTKEELLDLLS
ncbi:DEAD/DEAH box helicase [Slackia heliotrinireducens]|uniref:DEAD/DEAH box helicase n=1 Tax=Slackia heliotrinireducens TaxID=84110 RepID=UPI0033147E08